MVEYNAKQEPLNMMHRMVSASSGGDRVTSNSILITPLWWVGLRMAMAFAKASPTHSWALDVGKKIGDLMAPLEARFGQVHSKFRIRSR